MSLNTFITPNLKRIYIASYLKNARFTNFVMGKIITPRLTDAIDRIIPPGSSKLKREQST